MVGFTEEGSRFNSSREEIIAFRNMDDNSGCGNDGKNCNSRDGNPHNWTYMDDLQDNNHEKLGVSLEHLHHSLSMVIPNWFGIQISILEMRLVMVKIWDRHCQEFLDNCLLWDYGPSQGV